MDITVQNKKIEAKFKNGKYFHTFTPKTPDEVVKIHHEGCVGDTRLTHIQLEQNNDFTYFVEPSQKVNSLSGIFKNLRDLDVQLRDQNSDFWGKIKLNNKGMLTEFYNQNIETKFTAMAGTVNAAVKTLENNVVKKSDVTITPNSISFGTGQTIDGNTVASLMKLQPDSIKLISPLISVTGDMIVDGALTSNKFAANSVKAGHIAGGAIEGYHIKAGAFEAEFAKMSRATIEKLLTNTALITELFAQKSFINNLKTVNFDFTKGTGAYIQSQNGDMKWDLNNNSMILKNQSSIEFKNSGNVLFREYNGQKAFINFVDSQNLQESTVVIGGNRNNSFNPNNATFVGMRVFPKSDEVSFIADSITAVGGLGENNGFEWNVLNNKLTFKNTSPFEINRIFRCSSATDNDGKRHYGNAVITMTGTDTPLYPVYYIYHQEGKNGSAGAFLYSTAGAYLSVEVQLASDERLKKDIYPTKEKALTKLDKINFKEFRWRKDNNFQKLGMIAQELKKIEASFVSKIKEGNGEVYKLNLNELTVYALKAIQELSEENKQIKKEMEILKNAR